MASQRAELPIHIPLDNERKNEIARVISERLTGMTTGQIEEFFQDGFWMLACELIMGSTFDSNRAATDAVRLRHGQAGVGSLGEIAVSVISDRFGTPASIHARKGDLTLVRISDELMIEVKTSYKKYGYKTAHAANFSREQLEIGAKNVGQIVAWIQITEDRFGDTTVSYLALPLTKIVSLRAGSRQREKSKYVLAEAASGINHRELAPFKTSSAEQLIDDLNIFEQ